MDLRFNGQPLANMASETMLESKPGDVRYLDGKSFMTGIEAIDQGWDRDRNLGSLYDRFLCIDDCQVDRAVWRIIRHRVNVFPIIIVIHFVALESPFGVVVQDARSTSVNDMVLFPPLALWRRPPMMASADG